MDLYVFMQFNCFISYFNKTTKNTKMIVTIL